MNTLYRVGVKLLCFSFHQYDPYRIPDELTPRATYNEEFTCLRWKPLGPPKKDEGSRLTSLERRRHPREDLRE